MLLLHSLLLTATGSKAVVLNKTTTPTAPTTVLEAIKDSDAMKELREVLGDLVTIPFGEDDYVCNQ